MPKQVIAKRYQFWGAKGIEWSPWFPYSGTEEKWQLKSQGLRNEYKYKDTDSSCSDSNCL